MNDIVVKDLCKNFGEKRVLNRFSAVFPAERVTCVMGKSGCGKTTLIQILLGLETPDAGSIMGVPERVSAVFQEDRLCEEFSAAGNIRLVTGGQVPQEQIVSCLSAFGLSGEAQTPVREMSGGMKRRVAIARAVLADGELLVMDEPFKGLDTGTRAAVAQELRRRFAGRTVILVTHSPEEAALFDAEVIRMEEIR